MSSSHDDQLESFLRSDHYEQQINGFATGARKRLVIDFLELATLNQEYARSLQLSPEDKIKALQFAFSSRLQVLAPNYKHKFEALPIGFRNFPENVPLRKLHEHISELVSIRGIITRGTLASSLITRAKNQCKKCQATIYVDLDATTGMIPHPAICPKCRGHLFTLLPAESDRVPVQTVTIQELPEDMVSDKPPAIYNIRLLADLVDTLAIGAHVVFCVVPRLSVKQRRSGTSAYTSTWLDAWWLEDLGFEERQELADEDIQKIKDASQDAWLERRMITSICPSLFGMEEVKQAVLYQMLGGVDHFAPDGTYQRGFSNILIIADPSTGKTTLLNYISSLVPRGRYTSAVSSSGKGLTALIGKDENGVMELRIGAVVMSNNSICGVDEIDKCRPDDRVALHECMESGKITIDKGGFNTQLHAHTAILAAGNPTLGRYDPYKNVTENINLPVTLLSRFDLIFIMRDVPDKESDRKVIKRMLAARRGDSLVEEGHDYYERSFMRKYLMVARRYKPKLTDEAMQQIEENYLTIREKSTEDSPFMLAPRQGDALMRLAEARAKLHLRNEVLKEDVQTVWALMNRSLQQTGVDAATGKIDIDTIMTGKPTSKRNKMELVLEMIAKLEKESDGVEEQKLIGLLASDLTEQEVREILFTFTKDGMVFSPKSGIIKRVRL
jgi:replicative DNA helicase Mcm